MSNRSTMRIMPVPRSDGMWIEISSRNRFSIILKFLGLALGCAAMAWLVFQSDPDSSNLWLGLVLVLQVAIILQLSAWLDHRSLAARKTSDPFHPEDPARRKAIEQGVEKFKQLRKAH